MSARRTELASGATVISEPMAAVKSVSIGLYFPPGSRHETARNNGVSHFIEHLVFKGTPSRSADAINREIDLLGGASNAYTSKETVCLHSRVLADNLPRLLALFGDLATEALPAGVEEEVERERRVILAEIRAVDDSPEDLLGDVADDIFFGDHPLALPVVGSAPAVERLALADIRAHYQSHLVARDLGVAAAGKLDHDALVGLVEQYLGALRRGEPRPAATPPVRRPATRVVERELEQVQVSLSAPGVSGRDPRWPAAELLSVIVGDGYSSRLFREVRDRRGLAYSIYSSLASYTDAGRFDIDFAVAPDRLEETLQVTGSVLQEAREGQISSDELEAARQHLVDSIRLGHESTGARMSYLAEQVLFGEDNLEIERDIEAVARVRLDEVRALGAELLSEPLSLAAVGPVSLDRLPADGFRLPE